MTILEKLERIPPYICRYLARKNHGKVGMSHADIQATSKLSLSTVRQMSFATSWRGYSVETAIAFAMACGVNHLAAEKQLDFLKRRNRMHVRNATGNQKQMYDRLERLIVSEVERRNHESDERNSGARETHHSEQRLAQAA